MRKDVQSLTSFGERQVGSQGHEKAKEYILNRMTDMGLNPYLGLSFDLNYEKDGIQFSNLVARIPGNSGNRKPILIGAHYDTCGPYPGADDNASAVTIILTAVRKLKSMALDRDVIIAFFDAEEPPYFHASMMGSIHFYNNQKTEKIDCAIILDLVGHDVPIVKFEDILFITGMESHSEFEKAIKKLSAGEKIRAIPTLNKYVGDMSDHHIFRVNNIPYLFLSCGRWEHYHMPTDTHEKLNYGKMENISYYLLKIVDSLDKSDFEKGSPNYDSTPTELSYLNTVFLELFRSLGFAELKNREDIDALAKNLVGVFGL